MIRHLQINIKNFLKLVSTTIGCITFMFSCAYSNPEDGVVSAGSATITSKEHYTEINQYTDRAVIDWRKFDLAPNEHANFKQPSNESITLNRVNSNEASNINGKLTANGKLIMINQNGILFGKSANIDVNGLLATTANVANEDFMQRDKAQQLLFSPTDIKNGYIINEGEIKVASGLVGLVAPNVLNSGIIIAKAGKVELASSEQFTLDLYGDRLLDLAISNELKSQILANTGQVIADGGEIILTASAGKEIVNNLIINKGILKARSIDKKNGEIIISAEGSNAVKGNLASNKGKKQGTSKVEIAGVLDVSGLEIGESGGKLQITGDEIALTAGTLINASGYSGKSGLARGSDKSAKRIGSAGGEILIGGDYLGQGAVPTALKVYVAPNVMILNDSIFIGDAGRSIFWSDEVMNFYGNLCSRAIGGKDVNLVISKINANAVLGGNVGDGGFVETSGKLKLDVRGDINLTSSNGRFGTYLLDPNIINIYSTLPYVPEESIEVSFLDADYLRNLSNNQDLVITANTVNLDLNNDHTTFNLSSGKNLQIIAKDSLNVISAGTITTTKDFGDIVNNTANGNIIIQVENGNIDLTNLNLISNNGGYINIIANSGDVTVGDITAGAISVYANAVNGNIKIAKDKMLITTTTSSPWFNINNVIYDGYKGFLNIEPTQDNYIINYGEDLDPSKINWTVTGYIDSDSYEQDILLGNPMFKSNSYTIGSAVGSYNLVIEANDLRSSFQYKFKDRLVNDFIQVIPKKLAVYALEKQGKEFGDVEPTTLNYNYNRNAVILQDKNQYLFNGELSRVAGEEIGRYEIEQGTLVLNSSNYVIEYIPADFKIYPKINFTGELQRAVGENTGIYEYTLGALSAGSAIICKLFII